MRPGKRIDFEAGDSYTLDLIAIDNGFPPLAGEATVTLIIQDVNEPPVLNLASVELPENSAGGTSVVTLQAIDPEGIGSGYVITLLDGADASDFDFDPVTGQLSVATGATLDFETQPVKELHFQISDPSGNDATTIVPFFVFLGDENDPPTLITNHVIISELAAPGTVVGRVEVQVRDVDTADSVTAEIIGGNAASLFNLNAQTRILTVADGAQFDADVSGEVLILQVRVEDAGGLSSVGEIVVQLNDVNEPPVFTSGAPSPAAIVSGQPFELILPNDFIVDPEGQSFSIAVFGSNGPLPAWLHFNESTRTLSGLPDPSLIGSYPLLLQPTNRDRCNCSTKYHSPLWSSRDPRH